jgi:hypothetical protein
MVESGRHAGADIMNLEDTIREAIIAELQRQSEVGGGALKVAVEGPTMIRIEGLVNLVELAMVIVGRVAGGP